MEDIRSILSKFPGKPKAEQKEMTSFGSPETPTTSEIPDVFFDEILTKVKLSRQEITVLMYLYRYVWCRPNLYKGHGIGPIHSYGEMGKALNLSLDEIIQCLRHLEAQGLVQTIRAGQYFVRRYFTEELDQRYQQLYDF
jgi:DNA-binding MarR family transcriptional regulator